MINDVGSLRNKGISVCLLVSFHWQKTRRGILRDSENKLAAGSGGPDVLNKVLRITEKHPYQLYQYEL